MTSIFCTFQVCGFHGWPDAPEAYSYLRALHRHVFHARVDCKVEHNDRAVEFIDFKAKAQKAFESLGEVVDTAWSDIGIYFGSKSCEMLATELLKELRGKGYLVTRVEISEDGENGSTVTSA